MSMQGTIGMVVRLFDQAAYLQATLRPDIGAQLRFDVADVAHSASPL